jgi:hypothetical protein
MRRSLAGAAFSVAPLGKPLRKLDQHLSCCETSGTNRRKSSLQPARLRDGSQSRPTFLHSVQRYRPRMISIFSARLGPGSERSIIADEQPICLPFQWRTKARYTRIYPEIKQLRKRPCHKGLEGTERDIWDTWNGIGSGLLFYSGWGCSRVFFGLKARSILQASHLAASWTHAMGRAHSVGQAYPLTLSAVSRFYLRRAAFPQLRLPIR